jgi:hypothetical protein
VSPEGSFAIPKRRFLKGLARSTSAASAARDTFPDERSIARRMYVASN